ncbi:MAG: 23S rRNA (uracil(1939)-C(5))-methyltransferase RlmD [Geobacteraceae bacterium]|nr:23S rRNA (uracil(1939)-C(5))-methyltransferase RlmD [Geobacteraceae bacterium]
MSKLKPKVGQVLDLAITTLDEEGYGLSVHETSRVRVAGVLPGETVRTRVTFSGQRDTFAETLKILRHSPDRLAQIPCGLGNACEGCPLIHMKYRAQLDWKRQQVESAIKRFPSLRGVEVGPVAPSAKPLGYRNTAKLVISGRFASPVIGIYRRNSHQVMDIADCPLHHPLINRIALAVREGIIKGKVPIYNPKTRNGLLRYLAVRVSELENRAMVVFVTSERSYNEIHHLAKHLQAQAPEVAVVCQNVNSSAGNIIMGDRDYFVTKQQTLAEAVGDVRFSISPRSFFQVNNDGARTIYGQVREWAELTGSETVVDVYCGVGGISLYLASGAREVIGFESVDAAVADAEKNARLNGLRNCRFEAGDAAELLSELHEECVKVDLVVLNPPRKGCDEEVLKSAAGLDPKRIIYVSCSPQTLVRDLNILSGLGYVTHAVQPVDMFPQTIHVENVALVEKGR